MQPTVPVVAAPGDPNIECVTFVDVVYDAATLADLGDGPGRFDTSTAKAGDKYQVRCINSVTNEVNWSVQTWGGNAPARTPRQVAQDAFGTLAFPVPTVETWPRGGHAVVGIRTFFHVTNFPDESLTAAAQTDAVISTVTATPVATHFRFGPDPAGKERLLDCKGAGTIWKEGMDDRDKSYCAFTFWQSTHGQPLTASVAVEYKVTWTSNVGPAGDLPADPVSSTFPIVVRSYEAVIK